MVDFIPGWHSFTALAKGGPIFDHIASTADGNNQSTYTFAGQQFGAEAVDRHIFVAAVGGHGGGNSFLSTITVAGSPATIHVTTDNNGNTRNGHTGIASLFLPSGTSGDIAVAYTGTMQECTIAVYRAVNLFSNTPYDTEVADSVGSLTLDIPPRGFLIACAAAVSGSDHTWPSPMIETLDLGLDGVQCSHAHALAQFIGATGFSAKPSPAGGTPSRYAAASWR